MSVQAEALKFFPFPVKSNTWLKSMTIYMLMIDKANQHGGF